MFVEEIDLDLTEYGIERVFNIFCTKPNYIYGVFNFVCHTVYY